MDMQKIYRQVTRITGLGMVVLMLAACAGSEYADLDEWIKNMEAAEVGGIEPLPPVEEYPSKTYSAELLRDPFSPWVKSTAGKLSSDPNKKTAGLGCPARKSEKESLENVPLDTLRMVGTLRKNGQMWAIVKAPDHGVYHVRVGNHMGLNRGKVTVIDEGKIELMEIVEDGSGGCLKRKSFLAISD